MEKSKCSFTIPFSSCRGDLGFFSTVNQDGFKPNLETHLIPLLATKIEDNSLELKDQSNDSFLKDALHPLLKQVLFIPLATISIVLFVESKGGGNSLQDHGAHTPTAHRIGAN